VTCREQIVEPENGDDCTENTDPHLLRGIEAEVDGLRWVRMASSGQII
jgi:hypothetical protein